MNSPNSCLHFTFYPGEIQRVFGKGMLEYVNNLAEGNIDFLPRMPKHLLLNILSKLELEDLNSVAQVSKQFRKVGLLFQGN